MTRAALLAMINAFDRFDPNEYGTTEDGALQVLRAGMAAAAAADNRK